ncbi:hypothetical protein AYI70_g5237 [Smittium culicis]|uniref:Uncharacterized protein n=1 Tax=Smittium culicis TaxID=133412 RepID=A0A1R1XVI2_9FUNG|nr:hypothetical protein AYI70_g5237 [Smittium culicis]
MAEMWSGWTLNKFKQYHTDSAIWGYFGNPFSLLGNKNEQLNSPNIGLLQYWYLWAFIIAGILLPADDELHCNGPDTGIRVPVLYIQISSQVLGKL